MERRAQRPQSDLASGDGKEETPLTTDGTAEDSYGAKCFGRPIRRNSSRSRPRRVTNGTSRSSSRRRATSCSRKHRLSVPEARRRYPAEQAAPVRRGGQEGNRGQRRAVPQSVERRSGALAARLDANSRFSTTSAATRCCGSSRSTRRPADAGDRRRAERRRSSTMPARSFAASARDQRRNRSGCPSATAGTTSTSTTRRPAQVKNQITQGRVGRPRRRPRGRGQAPDLVPRRRHPSRAGPVLRPLLPRQFDGTGLIVLTEGDGTHDVEFSPDGRYLRSTPSRASISRRSPSCAAATTASSSASSSEPTGRALLADRLASRPSDSSPRAATARPTSTASSIGPTNFDREQEVPGDREHLRRPARCVRAQGVCAVPSARRRWPSWASSSCRSTAWARNWRSKAFHDVCWKNLGDAGFPDRIAWMKAAAAKHP